MFSDNTDQTPTDFTMNTRVCIALLFLSLLLLVESRPGIPGGGDMAGEDHLAGNRRVWRRIYRPEGKPWWWCRRYPRAPVCPKEPRDLSHLHVVSFIKISNRSYI